ELQVAVNRFLDSPIVFHFGDETLQVPRRQVGIKVELPALEARCRANGHSGNPALDLVARARARRGQLSLPIPGEMDSARALEFLTELKGDLDRSPLDARLDLEHHTVAKERPGQFLNVYGSMGALADAVERGASEVELQLTPVAPKVKSADLEQVDISTQ